MQRLSVIIPFYKDLSGILTSLRHNKKFLTGNEIIIINDSPEINTDSVKELMPNIIILTNSRNMGFGQTVNNGVAKSTAEYVMLLNSDVLLNDRTYENTLTLFSKDQQLFATSFAQKEKNGNIVGANEGYFTNGMFNHRSKLSHKICETLWPEGGSCVIRKQIYVHLHGFDKDYAPFYWEDVDLGYRAKQAGYHCIYNPEIIVEHHHETTIGTYFTRAEIDMIATRNQFLFIWKNIRGWQLLQHIIWLPAILWSQRKNRLFVPAFRQALTIFLAPHS